MPIDESIEAQNSYSENNETKKKSIKAKFYIQMMNLI
jgi:hypothetical protein